MKHAIRRLREELELLKDTRRQVEADLTVEPDLMRRNALLGEFTTEIREVCDALRILRAIERVHGETYPEPESGLLQLGGQA